MKYLTTLLGTLGLIFSVAACGQQAAEQAKPTAVTGGMIVEGDFSGSEFTIAEGIEMDTFMEMVEAFNNMDAAGIFAHSADAVTMLSDDGSTVQITQSAFEGLFSTLDSLSWDVHSAVPLQIEGTDVVKVMADTHEVMYAKDGTTMEKRLFEEFTFENGILVSVRQWSAEMPEGL